MGNPFLVLYLSFFVVCLAGYLHGKDKKAAAVGILALIIIINIPSYFLAFNSIRQAIENPDKMTGDAIVWMALSPILVLMLVSVYFFRK